ncbi:MAG: hypothetical protein LBB23_02945 [Rickettsiales bacterium]|jgi:hypothetical protein|nr:hypothetical protein [Rickettsiales bacterium]
MKNTKTNGKISRAAMFAAKYLPASMAVAMFAGCLNPANEADETTAANQKAPLIPYSIEETTPAATPKQVQKTEGSQALVATEYYFNPQGSEYFFKLKNPNQIENLGISNKADDYTEKNLSGRDTVSGSIRALDSIFVWTNMPNESFEAMDDAIFAFERKTGADFYDALNKFVEDYTLAEGRIPRVIYRLNLQYINSNHLRFAEGINMDTISIGNTSTSSAKFIIDDQKANTRDTRAVIIDTSDLEGMHAFDIVGGKTPATSVLENPRVVPNNNPRNYLYKTTGTRGR